MSTPNHDNLPPQTMVCRPRSVPLLRYETLNGKRYRILHCRMSDAMGAVGEWNGDATIFLDDRLVGLAKMETAIHEALHACLDDLPEDVVERISNDVSRFAYRIFLAETDQEVMDRLKETGETALSCTPAFEIYREMQRRRSARLAKIAGRKERAATPTEAKR